MAEQVHVAVAAESSTPSSWSKSLSYWNSSLSFSKLFPLAEGRRGLISWLQGQKASPAKSMASQGPIETSNPSTGINVMESTRPKQVAVLGSRQGPLGFIMSSYAIVLVVVAVLVNRIQHIVPPRRLFRPSKISLIGLRLPSVLCLTRATLAVCRKIPRLSAHMPSSDLLPTDHADIMWAVFVSLILACVTETFVKALNNDLNTTSPLNLLSFSYLLHGLSSPSSSPSIRPTPEIFAIIGLTLAEVLSLQVMEALELNLRLFVTGFYSTLGQVAMLVFLLRDTQPASTMAFLPWLQYLNRFPELVFFFVSAMTVALHAITHLIVDGKVDSSIFGHPSNLPSRSDDWAIAIMRYGTACLEATSLSGFGNEVHSVPRPPSTYVELGRGVGGVPSVTASNFASARSASPQLGGYHLEVKDVRARSGVPEGADPMSRTPGLSREAYRFVKALCKVLLGIVRLLGRRAGHAFGLGHRAADSGRLGFILRYLGVAPQLAGQVEAWVVAPRERSRQVSPFPETDEDDEDDEDYVPGQSDTEVELESDDEPLTYQRLTSPEIDHPLELWSELNDPTSDDVEPLPDMPPVLLAHLTRTDATPLTRRRYSSLTDRRSGAATADAILAEAIVERRRPHQASDEEMDWQREAQTCCVVCRVELRTIIFWPCRCLALCEACKDHLGARHHSTSQHLCPCCRRPVEGFSRIYTP